MNKKYIVGAVGAAAAGILGIVITKIVGDKKEAVEDAATDAAEEVEEG